MTVLVKKEIEEALKTERKTWMKELDIIGEKCNHNEQYSRKFSVRIHGKDEAEGENVEHVAIKVFKDSLGIEVSPDDIDIVHRTEVKKQGKSRPILVKLKSHKTKVNIFKEKKVNRERLVEKDKMNITEDLTIETYKKPKEIRILTNVTLLRGGSRSQEPSVRASSMADRA